MIEIVIYLALTFCGPYDLACREAIEMCLLDEGPMEIKFCGDMYVLDKREGTL